MERRNNVMWYLYGMLKEELNYGGWEEDPLNNIEEMEIYNLAGGYLGVMHEFYVLNMVLVG